MTDYAVVEHGGKQYRVNFAPSLSTWIEQAGFFGVDINERLDNPVYREGLVYESY